MHINGAIASILASLPLKATRHTCINENPKLMVQFTCNFTINKCLSLWMARISTRISNQFFKIFSHVFDYSMWINIYLPFDFQREFCAWVKLYLWSRDVTLIMVDSSKFTKYLFLSKKKNLWMQRSTRRRNWTCWLILKPALCRSASLAFSFVFSIS